MTVRSSATRPAAPAGVQRGRISACLSVILGVLLTLSLAQAAAAQGTPSTTAPTVAAAQPTAPAASRHEGGEANLILPDLSQVQFVGGYDGRMLLMSGL